MKFVLFVEGHTEYNAIPSFLKRWLDPRLPRPVGIQCVRFEGWAALAKEAPTKANLYLARNDVIAVIALLDLYGPTFSYPPDTDTADERYRWAKQHLEDKVNNRKFLQFFAVHEVEAWLLSDPSIFPNSIRTSVQKISKDPETVDDIRPPAKRLNEIYKKQTKKRYKKTVYGRELFAKLDPGVAYGKCPHLKEMLDTMKEMAVDANKKTDV